MRKKSQKMVNAMFPLKRSTKLLLGFNSSYYYVEVYISDQAVLYTTNGIKFNSSYYVEVYISNQAGLYTTNGIKWDQK